MTRECLLAIVKKSCPQAASEIVGMREEGRSAVRELCYSSLLDSAMLCSVLLDELKGRSQLGWALADVATGSVLLHLLPCGGTYR